MFSVFHVCFPDVCRYAYFPRAGARALAKSLPKMEELRVLNLNDCLLRSAGARAIAAAISGNNPKLEVRACHPAAASGRVGCLITGGWLSGPSGQAGDLWCLLHCSLLGP